MKSARADDAGGTDGFGKSLARQIDLEYIHNATTRDRFSKHEQVGLAWVNWGTEYAKAHALSDHEQITLEHLQAALEQGSVDVSLYVRKRALSLIREALDGDPEARTRMLRWARELFGDNV